MPKLTVYRTILSFNNPARETFEYIVGKGENAGNQHFLLFPQCFQIYQKQILICGLLLDCGLQMLLMWISPKFCLCVKG